MLDLPGTQGMNGGGILSCEKCSWPKPFCRTCFGSQKWSEGKLWHPKPVPTGTVLAAKSGSTLPKVVLGGGSVLVTKSGSGLGCQSGPGWSSFGNLTRRMWSIVGWAWGSTMCVCVRACVCKSTSARMYPDCTVDRWHFLPYPRPWA